MKYLCEDNGGTTREIEADSANEAAIEFCEQTVDTDVEDLPGTIHVSVTNQETGANLLVYVDTCKSVSFEVN